MTFTYTQTLLTDRDKIRFAIGDTTEDSGVLPGGSNFSDEELAGLVTQEGSWEGAVLACFNSLSARYGKLVDFAVGQRRESLSQAAESFRKQAEDWKKKHGLTSTSVGTRGMVRVDGYSDDVASDDV